MELKYQPPATSATIITAVSPNRQAGFALSTQVAGVELVAVLPAVWRFVSPWFIMLPEDRENTIPQYTSMA
jgi:hypothetical protein